MNKRKTYRSRKEGFVGKVGGRKLGQGTLLIPARALPQLEALLQKRRAERRAFTVWIEAATGAEEPICQSGRAGSGHAGIEPAIRPYHLGGRRA